MENTGEKIKSLGGLTQVLGIICSIILAIYFWVQASELSKLKENSLIVSEETAGVESIAVLSGFIILILGILASIASGIIITGFGELVENSENTAAYSAVSKKANTDTKELVSEMNATLKSININLEKLGSPSVSRSTKEVVSNIKTQSAVIGAMVEKLEDTTYVVVEGSKDTTEMWKCPNCNNFNFATSNECMNCHTKVKFK